MREERKNGSNGESEVEERMEVKRKERGKAEKEKMRKK